MISLFITLGFSVLTFWTYSKTPHSVSTTLLNSDALQESVVHFKGFHLNVRLIV